MLCKGKKKSKCPKKNFQSVKRGEECLSMEFRVFEKRIGRKILKEKKIKVFLVEKKKIKIFVVKEKLKLGKIFRSLVTLVGRYVD